MEKGVILGTWEWSEIINIFVCYNLLPFKYFSSMAGTMKVYAVWKEKQTHSFSKSMKCDLYLNTYTEQQSRIISFETNIYKDEISSFICELGMPETEIKEQRNILWCPKLTFLKIKLCFLTAWKRRQRNQKDFPEKEEVHNRMSKNIPRPLKALYSILWGLLSWNSH